MLAEAALANAACRVVLVPAVMMGLAAVSAEMSTLAPALAEAPPPPPPQAAMRVKASQTRHSPDQFHNLRVGRDILGEAPARDGKGDLYPLSAAAGPSLILFI
jgi:hypothetical protein